jgi:hypothetical protein
MKPIHLKGRMFRNRSFQVKLVKDQESDEAIAPTRIQIDPIEIIGALVTGGALLIGVYVASDTLRQVVLRTAETKIN